MPSDDDLWILGVPFLRKYVSYYNMDRKEVGLAAAALDSN